MEFFYFLFCLFCKLWVVRFCEYFLDLSFWFDEMYVTDWRGQWTRQLYPIYSHWREKEKKRFNPKEHLCCLQSNFRGKEFSLDVVVGPHLFIIGTNEFSRSFVSAIFQLNFAFGLNVCFFYFSGLRIKWKQTRCGGVTRDEWNVVSMTRGWNVKESRAVRLKVGLLNEETAKMNKVRP